jgi:hypothetical protein
MAKHATAMSPPEQAIERISAHPEAFEVVTANRG